MGGGANHHLIAAGAAALALPALALGLKLDLWLAGIVALLVYGGLLLVLRPQIAVGSGTRGELVEELLADAEPDHDRLIAAARAIKNKPVAASVKHLAELAVDIGKKLRQRPENVGKVSRFFTYYLPRSADFAEGYSKLEQLRSQDRARMTDAEDMLRKLEQAFAHYADSLVETDLGGLDVHMKLLRQSLESDNVLPPVVASNGPLAGSAVPVVGRRKVTGKGPWG
jgi:hypothetical protein